MMTLLKKLAPSFLRDIFYQLWPFLGAVIYGFPSNKTKVIGVTGTNGKTTVTHLTTEVLEKAGYKVASISSLRFKIGEREWKNMLKMTMPGRIKIQKFLREAVDAGCQYVVMEVTSEGIKQFRHTCIDFDVAVFTNLTPEHIERHGGFENYKKAKGELFRVAKTAIINVDDANSGYFSNLCKGEKYGYSVNGKLKMKNEKLQSQIKNVIEAKDAALTLFLPGEFNLYNALAAACVGLSQGISIQTIKRALEGFKGVPGRMEIVVREPFMVIVDYAHNPDALEKVYRTIHGTCNMSRYARPRKARKHETKMICVLGAAGGGRDKWKRPVMGKIAAQYCDQIILTNEDPYEEPPEKILEDIEKGIVGFMFHASCFMKILDRREAIKKALQLAKPNDIVLITGKGAEPLLMTNQGGVPWDDQEVVMEEFEKIKT